MTSDFKPEVVIWSKLRMRSKNRHNLAKSSVWLLKFLRHIGSRCRWIYFQWQIYNRNYNYYYD